MNETRPAGMDDVFTKAHLSSKNLFKYTTLEWLAWIGQPMVYDGGLCVNRTVEEHETTYKRTNGKALLCLQSDVPRLFNATIR